jgi:hypothetical protein
MDPIIQLSLCLLPLQLLAGPSSLGRGGTVVRQPLLATSSDWFGMAVPWAHSGLSPPCSTTSAPRWACISHHERQPGERLDDVLIEERVMDPVKVGGDVEERCEHLEHPSSWSDRWQWRRGESTIPCRCSACNVSHLRNFSSNQVISITCCYESAIFKSL